jgi:hypothetical protein
MALLDGAALGDRWPVDTVGLVSAAISIRRWCGVVSTTLATAGLGGVAQRGLGVGRMLMNKRRVVALSGVMVVSTAVGLARLML